MHLGWVDFTGKRRDQQKYLERKKGEQQKRRRAADEINQHQCNGTVQLKSSTFELTGKLQVAILTSSKVPWIVGGPQHSLLLWLAYIQQNCLEN